ncbi:MULTISPECIES: hypothetical protein [Kitasatospora]|uniref:Uncharacterized protein n=1 Tax=Kitasatospora cystarginea TaxID=58350 RepID=A0ABP5QJ35_9ACTN
MRTSIARIAAAAAMAGVALIGGADVAFAHHLDAVVSPNGAYAVGGDATDTAAGGVAAAVGGDADASGAGGTAFAVGGDADAG